MLGGEGLPRRQLDRMDVFDNRTGVINVSPRVAEVAGIDAFQPIKLGMKRGTEGALPVKFATRIALPAICGSVSSRRTMLRGKDHKLFRHAATDDTGAAHAELFGQRHFRTAFGCHTASAHAARAATDYKEVIVKSAHIHCLSRPTRSGVHHIRVCIR